MASLQELEEEITCPIHLEPFKEPVQLKCLHVLCSSDVARLTRQNDENIECPQCKQLSPKGDVRRDFRMQRLLDMYQAKKEKLKTGKKCQGCDGDVAEAWCFDCSVYLCKRCEKTHLRLPISAKHKVDTIVNVRTTKENRKTAVTKMVATLEKVNGILDRFKGKDDMVPKTHQGLQKMQQAIFKLEADMKDMCGMLCRELEVVGHQTKRKIKSANAAQKQCHKKMKKFQSILRQNDTKTLVLDKNVPLLLSETKRELNQLEINNYLTNSADEWNRVYARNSKILIDLHQVVKQTKNEFASRKRSLRDAFGSNTNVSEPKAKVDRPATSSDPKRTQIIFTDWKVVSKQPQSSTSPNTASQPRSIRVTLKATDT